MKHIKLWAGRFMTLTALGFVVYFFSTNSAEITSTDFRLRPLFVCISIVAGFAYFYLRNFIWAKLLQSHGYQISKTQAFHYFSSSEFLRYIPGNVWGLGARVVKSERYGIPAQTALLSLIEETALLITSVSVLSGLGLLLVASKNLTWSFVGIALLGGSFTILLLPFFITRGTSLLQKFFSTPLSAIKLLSMRKLISFYPLYLFMWICYAIGNVFLFYGLFSFSWDAFPLIMVFALVAWFIGYASLLTPSGLGVRELILSIGLADEISAAVASLFSLASRMWFTIIEIIFYFIVILLYKKSNRRVV